MLRPFVVACVLLGLSGPVTAQTFKIPEVSGGYAFLNDPKSETEFRAGWMIGVAMPVTDWLAAVGEGGGNYATVEGFGSDTRLAVHSLMGGARVSGRIGRLIEFGQVIAGLTRATGSRFGVTETTNAFAMQPGLGLDLPLRPTLAARAQIDVRYIHSQSNGNNAGYEVRFVAGVVYQRERR